MAEVTSKVTDLRKLVIVGKAMRAFMDGEEAVRMLYNGETVFNRAEYFLNVPDEYNEIEATGTGTQTIADLLEISSYKKDYNGVKTNIGVTGGDTTIPANEGTTEKTGTYTITQNVSGLQVTGTWRQKGKEFQYYSFNSIVSVSVSMEDVTASGGTSSPYVTVKVKLNGHYSDGSTKEVERTITNSNITVTSASGSAENSSGATYNTSNGAVSVSNLGHTPTSTRNVFVMTSLGGTMHIADLPEDERTVSWTWNGSAHVEQAENQRTPTGSPTYDISSSVPSGTLPNTTSTVTVTYKAKKTSYYIWDSAPSTQVPETTDETLYVSVDGAYQISLTGGSGTQSVSVGTNTATTKRSIKIRVYHSDTSLYDKTHTVSQEANVYSIRWDAPVLNGTVEIETIPANGSAVAILIPIKQRKFQYSEATGKETEITAWTGSVPATAIVGTAVSGTGASFSSGYLSASSLGRTETTSQRKVYTITSVSVTGGDTQSYQVALSKEIFQAKNTRYATSGGYVLEVSANPTTGIANTGGTSAISYNAREKFSVYYDADSNVKDEYSNVSATLTTDVGTLSSSSVSGSGTATLTLGGNTGAERKATVTLSKGTASKTCTVTQKAVSYQLEAGASQECSATASTVYVTFVSSRNGSPWQPTFKTNHADASVDTANIASSGTTYTVPVVIKENSSTSARDIVVTATQARYDTDGTATVTITQAGKAVEVVRTIDAYGSWNALSTKIVGITAFLSNQSGSSVTFTGITVELRRSTGTSAEAASLVSTVSHSGSVTVAAGGSASIAISDIAHAKSSLYNYWLSAYATQTTQKTYNEIEEYEPEG